MSLQRVAELVRRAATDSGVFQALKDNPARLQSTLGLTNADVNALKSATALSPTRRARMAVSSGQASGGTLLPPQGSGQFAYTGTTGTTTVPVPPTPPTSPTAPPPRAPPSPPPGVSPQPPPAYPPPYWPPPPVVPPPGAPGFPPPVPGPFVQHCCCASIVGLVSAVSTTAITAITSINAIAAMAAHCSKPHQ
jgi:hypothetical protein